MEKSTSNTKRVSVFGGTLLLVGFCILPVTVLADVTAHTITTCGANFPPCADTLSGISTDSGDWTFYAIDGSGAQQRRDVNVSTDQYTYSWYGGGLPYDLYLFDGDCTGLTVSECIADVGTEGYYTWEDNQTGGSYNFENETHVTDDPPEDPDPVATSTIGTTTTELLTATDNLIFHGLIIFFTSVIFSIWIWKLFMVV